MSILTALRIAVRSHRRSPGLALALILTIGIGAGGGLAVLAFVGGMAARPPASASPETLLSFARTATLLGWAAALILVMTCASVSALLLARATGRVRDTALRIAIGADRRTVATMHAAEATIVVAAGIGLAGMAAWWTASVFPLLFFAEDAAHLAMRPSISWLAWGAAAALAGLLASALVPVLAANHRDPSVVLRREAPGLSPSLRRLRTRLVTAQAAACALFVALAGVVRADVERSLRTARGTAVADFTVVRVAVAPGDAYAREDLGSEYLRAAEKALTSETGPDSVAWMSALPGGRAGSSSFVVERPAPRTRAIELETAIFDHEALPIVALTPIRGRMFGGRDGRGTCRAGLLNQAAADRYFAGNGLGASVQDPGGSLLQIVGVIPDTAATAGRPTIYLRPDQPTSPGTTAGAPFYTVPLQASQPTEATVVAVSTSYFGVMADPPVAGRAFQPADIASGCAVAIISEAGAREAFGGEAIGGALIDARGTRIEIVGVVRSADVSALQRSGAPWLLRPSTQHYSPDGAFVVRASGFNVERRIDAAVRSIAGGGPRGPAQTLREHLLGTALAPERIVSALMTVCAVLALALSVAGIHGAMSDYVARRRRELAVRLAMGAGAAHLVAEVVRQGVKLAFGGTLVGLGLAALTIPVLGTQIGPSIVPSAFSIVLAIIAMCVLVAVACAVPAWRAVAIDPKTLLQSE